MGALQDNSAHRNISESLLGSAGVGRCTSLSNWRTFGFSKQLAGRYTTATELELIIFWLLPLGGLMWHLSTQVNICILAA